MTDDSNTLLDENEEETETLDRTQELEDKYRRALADYQNLVRQHQKERIEYLKFANQELILEILPIIDSLEKAAQHLNDMGLAMVTKQFDQFLSAQGVDTIAPKPGESFDEHLHECIEVVDAENKKQHQQIDSLIQKGYRWTGDNSPVIRHAQVTVKKFKGDSTDENN